MNVGSNGPRPARRRPPPVRSNDDELARLVARNDQLEAENEALRAERDRLKGRIAELEVKVEELRRKARRQAAPFSRDQRKPNPRRGGRRPGADYGKRGRRPAPEEVDEVLEAPAPDRCDCGGEIELDRIAHQYQTELPEVHPIRRRFDVGVGHCRRCGRRHQGRHPLQSSDALGAASSMLGPRAVALATQLNKELGLSPTKTAAMLGQFGIEVTPGGIVGAIARQARSLGPTYAALCEGVRASGVVAPDETGWRVDASKAWLWAFVGDGVTVYLIAAGRGYEQAASVLGADFAGVLERDGWAPYRRFELASHQSCVAHLLRRTGEMISDSVAGQARIPHALRRLLLDALELRDRYRDALAGEGEVIEGTAVEITAERTAKQAAGGQAPLPGLLAGAKEQAEAAPETASATADEGAWGAIEKAPRSEPSPLASHPAHRALECHHRVGRIDTTAAASPQQSRHQPAGRAPSVGNVIHFHPDGFGIHAPRLRGRPA